MQLYRTPAPSSDRKSTHCQWKAPPSFPHRDGGVDHAHGEPGAAEDAVALAPRPGERVGPVGAGEAGQHGLHRHAAPEAARLEVDERAPVGRRPLGEHQQLPVALAGAGGLQQGGRVWSNQGPFCDKIQSTVGFVT